MSYDPLLVAFRGREVLVYHGPDGSHFQLLPRPWEGIQRIMGFRADDQDDAIDKAKYLLAQLGWNWTNDEQCLTFVANHDRKELTDWIRSQRLHGQQEIVIPPGSKTRLGERKEKKE